MSPNGSHRRGPEKSKDGQGMGVTGLVAWLAFLATVIIVVWIVWG